jgi:hypothetical protein
MFPRPARVLLTVAALGVLAAAGCSSSHHAKVAPRAERHPPVVFVSFDELSTTSLVGAGGAIDRLRYPGFAQLARDGDWFPYATAPADETPRAMGALLTGNLPSRGRKPTYRQMPRNLFTLLGSRYRVDASEEVSSLCPKRLCRHVRKQNQRSVLHELAQGRPQRFVKWVNSIRASRKPTLYFKHVLLPHGPWRYLPTGQVMFRGAEPVPGWGHAFASRWVSTGKYQRHLLQLGYVDHLLGDLIRRLKKQGLYDRALIVVTADNGESFGRVDNGHEASRGNFGDIALTPLFVKRPYQAAGARPTRHVRTQDIVPTVARLTHMPIHRRVSGHSIYGPAARKIPSGTLVFQRSGRRFTLTAGGLRRWARGAQRLKARLFGFGNAAPGLYGVGPYRRLVGTSAAHWKPARPGRVRAILNDRRAYASVRPSGHFIPTYVTGRLVRAGRRPPTAIAVAVNGRIVATSPIYRTLRRGGPYYSTLILPAALRAGANRVSLYAVAGPAKAPRLRSLSARP